MIWNNLLIKINMPLAVTNIFCPQFLPTRGDRRDLVDIRDMDTLNTGLREGVLGDGTGVATAKEGLLLRCNGVHGIWMGFQHQHFRQILHIRVLK